MSDALDINIPERIADARPRLLAFAISLTRNQDRAEDLVQETMMRALANLRSFDPATNLSAWLFTILRNAHFSQHRKRKREVEDADGTIAEAIPVAATQGQRLELEEAMKVVVRLPKALFDAYRLIVLDGYDYETAADVLECPVGTIKSRVNRANAFLANAGLISGAQSEDISAIRSLWLKGKSASQIAAETGAGLVAVMEAISSFGQRLRRAA